MSEEFQEPRQEEDVRMCWFVCWFVCVCVGKVCVPVDGKLEPRFLVLQSVVR